MKQTDTFNTPFLQERRHVLIGLFLAMVTLGVYGQVVTFDFVFDDFRYLVDNLRIQGGFTLDNIIWAFTTQHAGNWHPLTWLSHMLDIQLYGMNAGGHHLTNLIFHIANTLLLFFVLQKMTGELWQSGFVAALFAVHPLHVESVAWVAERKNVLSTFFWMLTLWSYIRYVDHPKIKRYLVVVFCFALGLMSKAMLVTLPFVLLLLDYWPLKRWQKDTDRPTSEEKNSPAGRNIFQLIWEKVPLLVLVVISSILTFKAQQSGGTVRSLEVYSLQVRVASAFVSYINYIGKAIWPFHLAVYYPHPKALPPWWQIIGSAVLVVAVCLGALRAFKRYPYVSVGIFWYFGTLVPVIGLVQVGSQAMADRYMYVPLIGLFIAIAWGMPECLRHRRRYKTGLKVSACMLLTILMIITWKQTGYWKDNITLFEHALKITRSNYLSHYNLGTALDRNGRTEEAIGHYLKALQIRPDDVDTHNNLGIALFRKGDIKGAISCFREALRINPGYLRARSNLEHALTVQQKNMQRPDFM